jgi:hypothetical protein
MLAPNRSLLNGDDQYSEDRGFENFYAQSPHNLLLEDYTEILYYIYRWNVPSIKCKMKCRWPNSMGEVDFLSFRLIDFYVPVLTPQLH